MKKGEFLYWSSSTKGIFWSFGDHFSNSKPCGPECGSWWWCQRGALMVQNTAGNSPGGRGPAALRPSSALAGPSCLLRVVWGPAAVLAVGSWRGRHGRARDEHSGKLLLFLRAAGRAQWAGESSAFAVVYNNTNQPHLVLGLELCDPTCMRHSEFDRIQFLLVFLACISQLCL